MTAVIWSPVGVLKFKQAELRRFCLPDSWLCFGCPCRKRQSARPPIEGSVVEFPASTVTTP